MSLHFVSDEERTKLLDDEENRSVRKLFAGEDIIGFKRTESFVYSDDRHRDARNRAIAWILRTTSVLRFQPQTAYLAVMNFDRYVSRKPLQNEIPCWAIRLLSMACLSKAASVKESKFVPISEYPQGDYNLGEEVRTYTESLVGKTLEADLHLMITPFDFLPFFIEELRKKSSTASHHSLSTAVIATFILNIIRDINLIEIRPSTVAVAAILRVMDQSLTTRTAIQCSLTSVSFGQFIEVEDVFECYNLMLPYTLDTDSDCDSESESESESTVGCFWKCISCFPFRLWRNQDGNNNVE